MVSAAVADRNPAKLVGVSRNRSSFLASALPGHCHHAYFHDRFAGGRIDIPAQREFLKLLDRRLQPVDRAASDDLIGTRRPRGRGLESAILGRNRILGFLDHAADRRKSIDAIEQHFPELGREILRADANCHRVTGGKIPQQRRRIRRRILQERGRPPTEHPAAGSFEMHGHGAVEAHDAVCFFCLLEVRRHEGQQGLQLRHRQHQQSIERHLRSRPCGSVGRNADDRQSQRLGFVQSDDSFATRIPFDDSFVNQFVERLDKLQAGDPARVSDHGHQLVVAGNGDDERRLRLLCLGRRLNPSDRHSKGGDDGKTNELSHRKYPQ
jgi:hypothetical protein